MSAMIKIFTSKSFPQRIRNIGNKQNLCRVPRWRWAENVHCKNESLGKDNYLVFIRRAWEQIQNPKDLLKFHLQWLVEIWNCCWVWGIQSVTQTRIFHLFLISQISSRQAETWDLLNVATLEKEETETVNTFPSAH